jgi:protein ImuB
LLVSGEVAAGVLLDVARLFSPRVAQENRGEVCLDLSGLGALYSSEHELGAALLRKARRAGLRARVGIGSGRFVARVAARIAEGVRVVPPGGERAFLAPLPVGLLPASDDINGALRRFGIERLGELAGLPPRDLGLRLGPRGLRLRRLARGEDRAPLVLVKVPERFLEEADAPYPLGEVEPLLSVLAGVFERLAGRLRRRGLAAGRLLLSLGLDPAGNDERCLKLASPTCRVGTWTAVSRLSLEERPPRAPVASVRAEAGVVPQKISQLEMFTPRGPAPEKLDDAIACLASLSRDGRVGSPRQVDSHRPGEFGLVPFGQRMVSLAKLPPFRIPLRIFRPPLEVQVRLENSIPAALVGGKIRGRVLKSAGPWRLEGEWWKDQLLRRDYYEVELSTGSIYRLYEDRPEGRPSNVNANASPPPHPWFVDAICS